MKDEQFELAFNTIKQTIRSFGAPVAIVNSLVNLAVLTFVEPKAFPVFFMITSFSLFATIVIGETLFAFYGWRLRRELDKIDKQ